MWSDILLILFFEIYAFQNRNNEIVFIYINISSLLLFILLIKENLGIIRQYFKEITNIRRICYA